MSRTLGLEDFSMLGPSDVLALDQYQQDQEPISNRRGRKRKLPTAAAAAAAAALELDMHAGPTPDISVASVARDDATAGGASELVPSFDGAHHLPGNESCMPPPEARDASMPSPNPNMLASPNAQLPLMSPNSSNLLGGQTPLGLSHGDGGMTPLNLAYGGVTPMQMPHEGMSPGYSADFNGSDLHNPAYTPAFSSHGGITPHHGIMDNLDSIPNLPADQVSSILNGTGLENIGFSNMGYDDPAPFLFYGSKNLMKIVFIVFSMIK